MMSLLSTILFHNEVDQTNEDMPKLEEGLYGIKHHPNIHVYHTFNQLTTNNKSTTNHIDLEKADDSTEQIISNTNMVTDLLTFIQSFILRNTTTDHEQEYEEYKEQDQEQIQKVFEFHKQQFIYDDFNMTEMV